MNRFFEIEGKFFTIMSRAADLFVLNILWIIFSLPIITMGASTTALFYVTMRMVKNEDSYIIKDFLYSFKSKFKQSTTIWLVMLTGLLVLFMGMLKVVKQDFGWNAGLFLVIFFSGVIYVFLLVYLFPVTAKFDDTIVNIFKNTLLISIRHLPFTLILSMCAGVLGFTAVRFPVSIPVWLFIGCALTAYLSSHIYNVILERYHFFKDKQPK